jgi:hypothetical protein
LHVAQAVKDGERLRRDVLAAGGKLAILSITSYRSFRTRKYVYFQ